MPMLDYLPLPTPPRGQLPSGNPDLSTAMSPAGYGPAPAYPVRVPLAPPGPAPAYPVRVPISTAAAGDNYPLRVPLAPPGPAPDNRSAFHRDLASLGDALAGNLRDNYTVATSGTGLLGQLKGYLFDNPAEAADRAARTQARMALDAKMASPASSAAAKVPAGKAQAAATPAAAATTAAAKAQALDPRTELNMNLARAVNQSLKSGFTLAGINGLDRVLPIASAPPRGTPGKDVAAYQAMSIGNALYGQDMARAQALRAQGDTAGAAEVENSAAKAALELYKTIYSGGNTLPDAIAQQITQAQGG